MLCLYLPLLCCKLAVVASGVSVIASVTMATWNGAVQSAKKCEIFEFLTAWFKIRWVDQKPNSNP